MIKCIWKQNQATWVSYNATDKNIKSTHFTNLEQELILIYYIKFKFLLGPQIINRVFTYFQLAFQES